METVRRRNQPLASQVKLTLRQRGAWDYSANGKLLKTGCLLRPQQRDFMRQLHAADFTQPAPPRVRCAAVPSRFTTYFDMRGRKRTARSASPCGTRANPDVYKLSALLHKYVGPTPNPQVVTKPPVPVGPRCLAMHTWGPVIYLQQTRSLRRRRPPIRGKRLMPRPARTLTIYANGAWSSFGFGKQKKGCLNRATMTTLRRLLRTAQFRNDPRQRVRCRAMPSMTTTIRSKRRSFTFRHPCGAALHPTLARLRNFVSRNVRR